MRVVAKNVARLGSMRLPTGAVSVHLLLFQGGRKSPNWLTSSTRIIWTGLRVMYPSRISPFNSQTLTCLSSLLAVHNEASGSTPLASHVGPQEAADPSPSTPVRRSITGRPDPPDLQRERQISPERTSCLQPRVQPQDGLPQR